jgi:hypothetical protein
MLPVGARIGLRADLRQVEFKFETGDALDDAVVRLADGGATTWSFTKRG